VNRAARLLTVASGGQVLVSGVAAELLSDELPEGVGLRELGTRQLKDLSRPERIYQVEAADLEPLHAELATADAAPIPDLAIAEAAQAPDVGHEVQVELRVKVCGRVGSGSVWARPAHGDWLRAMWRRLLRRRYQSGTGPSPKG
jgi:hypothetical protein